MEHDHSVPPESGAASSHGSASVFERQQLLPALAACFAYRRGGEEPACPHANVRILEELEDQGAYE